MQAALLVLVLYCMSKFFHLLDANLRVPKAPYFCTFRGSGSGHFGMFEYGRTRVLLYLAGL